MIFFFMVILLGLGSMVGTFEGVITPVYDGLRGGKYRKIPKQGKKGKVLKIQICSKKFGRKSITIYFNYNILIIKIQFGKCQL